MPAVGRNQHRECSLLDEHPDLPKTLQRWTDEGVKQKDWKQKALDDLGIDTCLRTLQRIMNKTDVQTARRNDMTDLDRGVAILGLESQDPLGRLGNRKMKEKLALKGVHITRDFIGEFRRTVNPAGAAARHPITRKIHYKGLDSSGPNEEWGGDGHEKLVQQMGIGVYGWIDKFSRLELGLWAVLNARSVNVPLTTYLLCIERWGCMPISTATDMGTEVGPLIAMQNTLRQRYLPALDIELVLPHNSTKSTYNITRERGWRSIWEQHLANILHFHNDGKLLVGFRPNDPLHESVRLWIWGQVVQSKLDEIVRENHTHWIRKQKRMFLPSGGRPIDFYQKPERHGASDQRIDIPKADIERLVAEYADPTCLRFATPDAAELYGAVWARMQPPGFALTSETAWYMWHGIVRTIESLAQQAAMPA